MHWKALGTMALLALAAAPADAQLDAAAVSARLDSLGEVHLARSGVTLLRYDYVAGRDSIEAIVARPDSAGAHPGILLIPGYGRGARDYLPVAIRLARDGFAILAVSQPGFGRSSGPADFVGPRTMAAIRAGVARWRAEPYVDSTRWGAFGYSRGAMAASLLAVSDSTLGAAMFAAGIYDFKKAHDEIKNGGIRANMEREAGMSKSAVQARSSILRMDRLACPVLILHGALDEQAPVGQAYALRDRLKALGKNAETRIVPGKGHDVGSDVLIPALEEFFIRWLKQDG